MTREEAIKMLEYIRHVGNGESEYKNDAQAIALDMAIKALEQQPKTAHWIMTGAYYNGAYDYISYVECSHCHEDSLEEGDYCPNCGARMVESEE